MSILIKNVTVLTLDDDFTVLPNTDIVIEGKKIVSIGTSPHGFEPEKIINADGYIALPAFFNAHTHSPMTFERGWAEDLLFSSWLNDKIWVAESAMTEDDVYWGAKLAQCEMIRSGIVGFADHYFWMERVAEVVENSKMKAALAWCMFGIGEDKEIGNVKLDETINFIKKWHGASDGKIRCFLGPHSPYMCPPEFLSKIVEYAQELKVGIHIHLSESKEQVENSLQQYGKTPVMHLESLGVFDVPCIAAHCIEVNDEDVSVMSKRGVNIAHTPKTYMKLAMGMAPIEKFMNYGINVCLGTDGPASNNDFNMLEILRITGLVHKNRLGDPSLFPNSELLRFATGNSANAMGFTDSGVLKEGFSADLILINTDKSHWIPRNNLAANVVYAGQPSDIEYVICDGKILLHKGELTTLDEEQIKFEAEKRAFSMLKSSMKLVRTYNA